ncbi:sensor domain-containing protein [Noviherbaspirillum sp. Root189]|uniref:sensor domain-containing protein n=1 Tax=Noviherbaspirillum sp. Root189 TaxID=1736487 RepID=UPI000AFD9344|nr:EAL domain-containing protein [Noviherbaspirillum sp. Root189]
MKLLFQEASQADELYRLIIDNALDAFVAIDHHSRIVEWSDGAERTFGWTKEEVVGRLLTDTIVPERFAAAHDAGLRRYLDGGPGRIVGRHVEMPACCKDGREIPVELTVTPMEMPGSPLFFASLRDISQRKALEESLHQHANITTSVLNSMADAVVVADLDERLIMVNPAGQRLLDPDRIGLTEGQSLDVIQLYRTDQLTPYPHNERPIPRALRGEHVDGLVAYVRHAGDGEGVWVNANARPLMDIQGALVGGVVVFHDITELRRREEAMAQQSRLLQKQASLLDLARDAILARTTEDVITYWNLSAEKLYQYPREEAVGQVSHVLLRTRFPQPLDEIRAIVQRDHYWEGEVIHVARDGREMIIFSQWALEFHNGQPYRYLETNADITQQVETERALKQSQQDFRLLVEASTDHAIMMIDPQGVIASWNSGAERIFGYTADEAIGRSIDVLFTREDRSVGTPLHELEEAKSSGRSDDDRWHQRKDGERFWATGAVTPLWNPDDSLRGYVKILRDQTTQRLAEEQTHFLANHDGLTGLPNRVYFSNQLHQSLSLSQRNGIPLAILLLDLDRFKYVNDTFGHHTGDLLLKEVALRIRSSIRESDFIARLGGDEFVIIQMDVSQPDASETLARKLVIELGRPFQLEGQEVLSGTSIGLCVFPKDGKSSVELLKRADLALYRAKNSGRHNFQFYTSDLYSEQTWKKDREAALRGALKNHQFELYYQPLVELSSWKISTVEALLRWNATELETVLPGEFLEIAEQSGLIVEIGQWALREACHQVRRWQAQGLSELRLSVNCSARQFNDPKFVAMIPFILQEEGLPAACLELEVPESMLAQHPEIKEQLSFLRGLGIRLTIDNFGTGATALIDFKDFGIDALKIDKAFVQHVPHRREDSAITSAIISLAHNLGISVVAGGVETAEQLAYLKARDCTGAQGFIFSPPLPAHEFEELMLNGSWARVNRIPGMNDGLTVNDLH